MIFVTVGSQKFQFNRLLEEIDNLIEKGVINEPVFAQKGYCDYVPKKYEYKDFLTREEFKEIIGKSSIVVTHGGTGAIINAVKKDKKVIAVARNCKHGEHVDNHQRQIVEQFREAGIILGANDCSELEKMVKALDGFEPKPYISSTKVIIDSLENDIQEFMKKGVV
ncbi:MAG: PssE/Cps14G family polysaccharide biosynthesis glycosyltransferase [Clostridia bacterium]|nr:PssE/Cps14G family polysaccharide biosynthesis glycosyltransferase [Clostridia bacterium]